MSDLAPDRDEGPLAAVERLAVAEELLALVRHDLRNHLATIGNATFFLQRRAQGTDYLGSDARVSQFFELIASTLASASSALDAPRPELARVRAVGPVSGNACVELAVANARSPEGVALDPDLGDTEVEADRAELALAIRCLVDNALEAGGGRPRASSRLDGPRLVIEVRDEGGGIPEAEREAVFEAFHTSKPGHLGLGLNIARRIARRYGGDVGLAPSERGTVATLRLPVFVAGEGAGA